YEGGKEEVADNDEVVDERADPPAPALEHDEDEVELDDGEGVPRKAKRKIEQWGDLMTFDFVDVRDAKDRGVGMDDDAREILVIRDIATKVVAAYPTASRSTDDVVKCLQRFKGKRKIKMAYSDEAGEFTAAADRLGIILDNSLPGRPRNNSIAERTNQFVLDTTSTCLLQAGLPASYWPYAINCVTHNLNIEDEVYELEGKGTKRAKMIPEEEQDILDGMTDDEGGDDRGGDGPSGDGAKTKKSIDAPPRPDTPTEPPDDP
ncbi:RE2, partial [Symbiodinium pilosum]